MKIGIVGSSSLLSYERFVERLSFFSFDSSDTIIAGNCPRGADNLSERFAKEKKLKLEVIPTEWTVYQTTALVRRNLEMAEKCDFVIFIHDYKAKEYVSILRFCANLKVPFTVVFW